MRVLCKASLFVIFLQHSFLGSQAQGDNYKITYRHCIQFDTMQTLRDTIGMEAVLIGNKKSSNYVYAKLPKHMAEPVQTPQNTIEQSEGENISSLRVVAPGTKYDAFGSMLFYDKKNDSVFMREKMPSYYVITKEVTPAINWKISEEWKTILGYKCRKATANFRGRNYESWFTKELPIVDGPWKFKTLPGLVLQIEDAAGQVKLYAVNIEKQISEPVAEFVNTGNLVSMKAYVDLRNKEVHAQAVKMKELVAAELQGMAVTDQSASTFAFYGIEKRLE